MNPQNNFSWVPNCSLGPPGCKTKVSLKQNRFGLCENAWFPWQHITDLRIGVCLKSTHISAVTYPILLNLIPNQSLDVGLLSPCCICKLSYSHLRKYSLNIKNVIHRRGYMYNFNNISVAFSHRLLKFVLNES